MIAALSLMVFPTIDVEAQKAKLDSAANAAFQSSHSPGMAIMIVSGSDTLLASGYGVRDIETRQPVTTSTVFQVGSITKEFTAALALQLVTEGRIRLNDSVRALLPDYEGPGSSVTMHQLLSHTSGIPNFTELPDFRARASLVKSPLDIQHLFENAPLAFAPGTRWAYSNSGYIMLGRIIERASASTWQQQIATRITRPLGLTGTRVCNAQEPPDARGYDREDDKLERTAPVDPVLPYAAGALCSTANDLTRWVRALASGRVVSVESYRNMTTPASVTGSRPASYGYGLELSELGGHHRVGHGGAIGGYDSYASFYPDDDLSVVVLMNLAGGNAEAIEKSLARIALGIADAKVAERGLSADDAKRFVGEYQAGGGRLIVTYTGSRLHVRGPVDADLARIDENVFVLADEPDVRLVFTVTSGEAGNIEWTSRGRTLSLPRIR